MQINIGTATVILRDEPDLRESWATTTNYLKHRYGDRILTIECEYPQACYVLEVESIEQSFRPFGISIFAQCGAIRPVLLPRLKDSALVLGCNDSISFVSLRSARIVSQIRFPEMLSLYSIYQLDEHSMLAVGELQVIRLRFSGQIVWTVPKEPEEEYYLASGKLMLRAPEGSTRGVELATGTSG